MRREMQFVPVNGTSLAYRFDGREGAPVLMLSNSLGTNSGMWDSQIERLSAHFHVLRYDARGHGESGVPPGPYDIDLLHNDVLGLLDALHLPQVSFCGLSAGGVTGMLLGIKSPGRIAKLVLCNTAARIGTPAMWNQRIAAVRSGGMAAVAPAVLDRWFTPAFRARCPERVSELEQDLVATSAEGYSSTCAAIRDMDLREMLGDIPVRTLVIAGSRDMATPAADGRLVADRIAGAAFVQLEAAHLSNIEQAEAFTDAVLAFLLAR